MNAKTESRKGDKTVKPNLNGIVKVTGALDLKIGIIQCVAGQGAGAQNVYVAFNPNTSCQI